MNVDLGVCMASRHSVGAHAAPLCPVCACIYHVVGHDAHCARKTTWLNMPKAQKKPVPVARNAEEKSRAVAAAMKSQGTKDAAMKKNKRAAKKDAVMKKDRSAAKKKTAVASPTGSASMSFDDRRKTTTSLVMLRPKPRIGFVTSAYGPMSSRRTVDARMCVIRGLEMRGIDLCRKVGIVGFLATKARPACIRVLLAIVFHRRRGRFESQVRLRAG